MVRIFFPDDLVDVVVKFDDPSVFGVCWFVQWVVAGDPLVALVVLGELRPQPEAAILEVLEVPDCRTVNESSSAMGEYIQFAM